LAAFTPSRIKMLPQLSFDSYRPPPSTTSQFADAMRETAGRHLALRDRLQRYLQTRTITHRRQHPLIYPPTASVTAAPRCKSNGTNPRTISMHNPIFATDRKSVV